MWLVTRGFVRDFYHANWDKPLTIPQFWIITVLCSCGCLHSLQPILHYCFPRHLQLSTVVLNQYSHNEGKMGHRFSFLIYELSCYSDVTLIPRNILTVLTSKVDVKIIYNFFQ